MIFIGSVFSPSYMTLKIKISDYGFEDDLEITGEANEVIEKFRSHMEEKHRDLAVQILCPACHTVCRSFALLAAR